MQNSINTFISTTHKHIKNKFKVWPIVVGGSSYDREKCHQCEHFHAPGRTVQKTWDRVALLLLILAFHLYKNLFAKFLSASRTHVTYRLKGCLIFLPQSLHKFINKIECGPKLELCSSRNSSEIASRALNWTLIIIFFFVDTQAMLSSWQPVGDK